MRERGLVHRLYGIALDALQQRLKRLFVDHEPPACHRRKDVSEPDLLWRNLQPRTPVWPFTLRDKPRLMQLQKRAPHHDRACAQHLANRRRGVHLSRLFSQHHQYPQSQIETSIRCHRQQSYHTLC